MQLLTTEAQRHRDFKSIFVTIHLSYVIPSEPFDLAQGKLRESRNLKQDSSTPSAGACPERSLP